MSLCSKSLVFCIAAAFSLSGCANFVETRTIQRFADNLKDEDIEGLQAATSGDFAQKALRRAESLDDFKIVNLPDGKTSVVEVEEVSDTEKRVKVEVGESKAKLLYVLKREPDSKAWLVDDIYMTQKKSKELKTAKSVTEQMDLLISVREFLDAWDHGTRESVLDQTTPEFREVLSDLPAAYLAKLTQQIAGSSGAKSKLRPRAELDEKVAVVRIPRATGQLVITYRLANGEWRADDVALESKAKEDHIASVRRLAGAVRTTANFLRAYSNMDKEAMARVTTRSFFRGSLAPGDLSLAQLPAAELAFTNYEINLKDNRADFVIDRGNEIVKLSLTEENDSDSETQKHYLVEDVTIYESDGSQEKRLSAMFTGHAIMHIFSDAIKARDLGVLRHVSSTDFNKRAWVSLDDESVREMPLDFTNQAALHVLDTAFQGAVTEIRVAYGNSEVTYVLRDRQGELKVDDVMLPVTGRTNSLKTTLELMVPINQFARGVRTGDLSLLQRNSSLHFNRLIWHQLNAVPEIGLPITAHLFAPMTGIDMIADKVEVTLGDDQFGAQVTLSSEHDIYVVDEVVLVAGPEPQQRTKLKHALRQSMANGLTSVRSGIKREPVLDEAAQTTAPQQFEPESESLY